MKKINHATISMTAICIILGFIIGIQVKTVKRQISAADIQRVNELSVELKKTNEEKEALTEKLSESEKKIREYEDAISDESESVKLLRGELDSARMLAGMTELAGRGVTVTLNDSSKQSQVSGENIDANAFLVHAEDILSVINELNVAGAEAISINGQRIVSSSSVRCAGSVVNINGVKIAAPFVITAIGDPDVMESALRFPGGVVDSLAPWGIEVSIKKSDSVTVASYTQAVKFNEAAPVKKEAE